MIDSRSLITSKPVVWVKMYFSTLELLRNISEWRAQTFRDHKEFDGLFCGSNKYTRMSPCLVENWKAFSLYLSDVEREFQARISEKHDQIKGLRDGVSTIPYLRLRLQTSAQKQEFNK